MFGSIDAARRAAAPKLDTFYFWLRAFSQNPWKPCLWSVGSRLWTSAWLPDRSRQANSLYNNNNSNNNKVIRENNSNTYTKIVVIRTMGFG